MTHSTVKSIVLCDPRDVYLKQFQVPKTVRNLKYFIAGFLNLNSVQNIQLEK